MKSTDLEAYQKLLSHLNSLGYHDFIGVHRELKYLAKNLPTDEHILSAVRGYDDGHRTVLCTLTNRRILFLDVGMVYSVRSSDVPLKMVNGISHNGGVVTCDLIVTNGANNMVVHAVLLKEANLFIAAVNRQIDVVMNGLNSNQASSNPADEIQKYKELLDQHAITLEQFERKRDELLK